MIGAAIGLVALSPLLAAIGAAVRLDSPGPTLYRARRAGRGGAPFTMYKFRTMHANRVDHGSLITTHGDRRVTRVGTLLRRARLDELPQLWNVLVGDMSLVGPRPEDPHYVELYTPGQRRVLDVRPGITGLAAIRYRDEERLLVGADWERTYVETVMPAKLAIEREYVDHWSLWLDVRILLETARSFIPGVAEESSAASHGDVGLPTCVEDVEDVGFPKCVGSPTPASPSASRSPTPAAPPAAPPSGPSDSRASAESQR